MEFVIRRGGGCCIIIIIGVIPRAMNAANKYQGKENTSRSERNIHANHIPLIEIDSNSTNLLLTL